MLVGVFFLNTVYDNSASLSMPNSLLGAGWTRMSKVTILDSNTL